MNVLNKIDLYFRSLSSLKFIIVITVLSFLVVFPINVIGVLNNAEGTEGINLVEVLGASSGSWAIFLVIFIIFIGPLVETLVFQWFIIRFLEKFSYFTKRRMLIGTLSAVAFGISRTYSLRYVIMTFVAGLLLSYAFIIYDDMGKAPFLTVASIHGLRNTVAVIFGLMFLLTR